jgi:hypothetical protein
MMVARLPITNHDEAAPRFSLLVGMQDADCAAEASEQNAIGITGLYFTVEAFLNIPRKGKCCFR